MSSHALANAHPGLKDFLEFRNAYFWGANSVHTLSYPGLQQFTAGFLFGITNNALDKTDYILGCMTDKKIEHDPTIDVPFWHDNMTECTET